MKMNQRKKKFSHWSRMNVGIKNNDKKNERKYCLNSILDMKTKQRKKNSDWSRINVTIKNADKKSNRKYCFNSILDMKMKERKKRILSLVENECSDEKCR